MNKLDYLVFTLLYVGGLVLIVWLGGLIIWGYILGLVVAVLHAIAIGFSFKYLLRYRKSHGIKDYRIAFWIAVVALLVSFTLFAWMSNN